MKKMKFATAFAAVMLSVGASLPAWPTAVPFSAVCEAASYIDESIRPIQVNVHTHYTVDRDNDGVLLRTSLTRVSFVGSQTGEVDKALGPVLWKYNDEKEQRAQNTREKMLGFAKQDRAERRAAGANFFPEYENVTDIFVRRADTLALSLLECSQSYEGGVHGMYGVVGRNFDAKSGRELTLDDVFTDRNELAGAIAAQLRRDYPSASFMESGGVGMAEMVEQLAKDGVLIWTLDPCGASFYFNPYIIGSYAEGIFTATILFDEYPALFAEKYRRAPKSYCMELRPWLPVRTTFADGSGTSVKVTTTDGGLRIVKGGAILDDWGETYGLRPVLVSLADGRRYLYVDGVVAGDAWERTRVYDLNGSAPVRVPMARQMARRGDIGEDYAEAERGPIRIEENRDKVFYIMANPEDFYMTLMDESTGKAELCQCRVGADGAPEILWTQDMG
ncbi:MAG: DUF3298 domain-containing protein [Schwartzia sp.]|nr:DUF3298 domain-containing protein [Schwartzia sp. (in: firmicutes)]